MKFWVLLADMVNFLQRIQIILYHINGETILPQVIQIWPTHHEKILRVYRPSTALRGVTPWRLACWTRFLLRSSMLMHAERDIVMANSFVCLSVRLSITLRYCIWTNAHVVKLFLRFDRGRILVFFSSATSVTKIWGALPQRGVRYKG